jgi:hypothetical protein
MGFVCFEPRCLAVPSTDFLIFSATFVTKIINFNSQYGQPLYIGINLPRSGSEGCCISLNLSTMVDFGSWISSRCSSFCDLQLKYFDVVPGSETNVVLIKHCQRLKWGLLPLRVSDLACMIRSRRRLRNKRSLYAHHGTLERQTIQVFPCFTPLIRLLMCYCRCDLQSKIGNERALYFRSDHFLTRCLGQLWSPDTPRTSMLISSTAQVFGTTDPYSTPFIAAAVPGMEDHSTSHSQLSQWCRHSDQLPIQYVPIQW